MVVVCLHSPLYARLLSHTDPSPLKNLAITLRQAQSERSRPSLKQTAPPSDLQQLVRDARATIIDPVLPAYAFLNEPDSEPDEPPDPEEIRRALEREKIRELKQRRFDSDAVVPVVAGLRRPTSASHGVFIRRDQADESAEVDISLDAAEEGAERAPSVFDGGSVLPMDVDTPPTSVASPMSTKAVLPPLVDKPTRDRRSTKKANASSGSARVRGKGRQPNAADPGDPAPAPGDAVEVPDAGKSSKKGKQMSETYKQAWSVSEQHLLERLLEEIPDGTKNRCVNQHIADPVAVLTNVFAQVGSDFTSHGRPAHCQTGRESRAEVLREIEAIRC